MNGKNILMRLIAGEFDMHYLTPEYRDGGELYKLEYDISHGKITKRKLVRKSEDDTYSIASTESFDTDEEKLRFIVSHPYFFPYDEDFKTQPPWSEN